MNRGDVVLVDWPYSDRTGSKLRPAIVVQGDFLNGLLDDTVLVQITSKGSRDPRHGSSTRSGSRANFRPAASLLRVLSKSADN